MRHGFHAGVGKSIHWSTSGLLWPFELCLHPKKVKLSTLPTVLNLTYFVDLSLLPWDIQPHSVGGILETLKDGSEICRILYKQGGIISIVLVSKYFLTNFDSNVRSSSPNIPLITWQNSLGSRMHPATRLRLCRKVVKGVNQGTLSHWYWYEDYALYLAKQLEYHLLSVWAKVQTCQLN